MSLKIQALPYFGKHPKAGSFVDAYTKERGRTLGIKRQAAQPRHQREEPEANSAKRKALSAALLAVEATLLLLAIHIELSLACGSTLGFDLLKLDAQQATEQ